MSGVQSQRNVSSTVGERPRLTLVRSNDDPRPAGTPGAVGVAMVRLTVVLRAVTSHDARDLLESLRFLMPSTRLDPGCVDCEAWKESEVVVHYAEAWRTDADVRRRVLSPEFTSLLGVIECASEPPTVRFDFIARTRGLDFVEEVREALGD